MIPRRRGYLNLHQRPFETVSSEAVNAGWKGNRQMRSKQIWTTKINYIDHKQSCTGVIIKGTFFLLNRELSYLATLATIPHSEKRVVQQMFDYGDVSSPSPSSTRKTWHVLGAEISFGPACH